MVTARVAQVKRTWSEDYGETEGNARMEKMEQWRRGFINECEFKLSAQPPRVTLEKNAAVPCKTMGDHIQEKMADLPLSEESELALVVKENIAKISQSERASGEDTLDEKRCTNCAKLCSNKTPSLSLSLSPGIKESLTSVEQLPSQYEGECMGTHATLTDHIKPEKLEHVIQTHTEEIEITETHMHKIEIEGNLFCEETEESIQCDGQTLEQNSPSLILPLALAPVGGEMLPKLIIHAGGDDHFTQDAKLQPSNEGDRVHCRDTAVGQNEYDDVQTFAAGTGMNEPSSASRRLRTQYRCVKCGKTFSNSEKLESHKESHEDELEEWSDQYSNVDSDVLDEFAIDGNLEVDSDNEMQSSEEDNESKSDRDSKELDSETCKIHASLGKSTGEATEVCTKESETLKNDTISDRSTSKNVVVKTRTLNRFRFGRTKGKFQCSTCGKTCLTKHTLRVHSKTHTNDRPFACSLCDATYKYKYALRNHVFVIHSKLRNAEKSDNNDLLARFKCVKNQCTSYFSTVAQLNLHVEQVHPDHVIQSRPANHATTMNPFQSSNRWCELCKRSFKCPSTYTLHYKTHHDLTNVDATSVKRCEEAGCSAYFKSQKQLNTHAIRFHQTMKTNSTMSRLPHVYLKDAKQRLKLNCYICPKWYVDSGCLYRHYHKWHNLQLLEGEIQNCDEKDCSSYFLTKSQLIDHKVEHHNATDPRKACVKCGKQFKTMHYLKNHWKNFHMTPDEFFPCSVEGCKSKFLSEKSLAQHTELRHTSGGLAQGEACPECRKVFPTKTSFIMHMRSHEAKRRPKPRSQVCEHCGKGFQTIDHLRIHYLSHSGPDTWKYQCSVCGKKCRSKQKLEEHTRTHTGEKSFICQYCGVAYAHKHNLRHHVNSKHPEAEKIIPRKFDKTHLTSRKNVKKKVGEAKVVD